jgi:6-hydroxynicotinate reductase
VSKIECNACPVLCQITEGRSGACDRYANVEGVLTRVDPIVLMKRSADSDDLFVTGVGSGTTYPDYKPAPFIVSSQFEGADTVTVVTEGIFSYCSFRIKIDTDRWLGAERAIVTHKGEAVGHVTTHEYGSQFLSIGGVHHLTGGSKKEGRIACDVMLALGNKQAVAFHIEGGADLIVQANKAPIVNGVEESRMRVGCGSATIGIFAQQWLGHVDEVVVVDDHITGVLSEHQAGQCLNMPVSGLRLKGRRSTPGRYFQVANPGNGWGGTDIQDPLSIIETWDAKHAKPGMRLLMVSTTGDHSAYFVLDESLVPQPCAMPPAVLKVVERIGENCEPSLCTVLYVGGAGGSLRAGVTDNPIALTQRIKDKLVRVTCGGAPAYVWPGGGITVMVDVSLMPENSFGSVPTPAIVSPIEFTMTRSDYLLLGGHADSIVSVADAIANAKYGIKPQIQSWNALNPWPQFPLSDT